MTSEELVQRALQYHETGQLEAAEELYSRALSIEPNQHNAQRLLGVIRYQQGRYMEALSLIDSVLEKKPDDVRALTNVAAIYGALGRFEEALSGYDRVLAREPDNTVALFNRGNTQLQQKRFDNALEDFNKVLAIEPNDFATIINRGNAFLELKRFEDALVDYDKALSLKPGFVEALNNRGVALLGLHRFEDAFDNFSAALQINPGGKQIIYNRSVALWNCGRFEEALCGFDGIIDEDPKAIEALYHRGNVLMDLKRYSEALESYERTIEVDPDNLYSQYALEGSARATQHLCNWSRNAELTNTIRAHVSSGASAISPFVLLGATDDASLHFQCARNNVKSRIPIQPRALFGGRASRRAKVRIAYISADFNRHPVAFQLAELFERHDRTRFEVLGISTGVNDGSAIRTRLSSAFDSFYDVRTLSDQSIAEKLREQEVDIAIELGGHTRSSRIGILSHRPCPVQVSYFGYPGTTGADFIDYIIGDPVVLPFDQQVNFSERIVQLPDCFWPRNEKERLQQNALERAEVGLPENGIVFCCFNNHWKFTREIFHLWMNLLAGIPKSVLWLKVDSPAARANLQATAIDHGLESARICFAPTVSRELHLSRYRLADLFLDTFPYNAHTTASDALSMGLPVLTCRGQSFASRVAASLLYSVGLPEFVTINLKDYERMALQFALKPRLLRSAREKLQQASGSPSVPTIDLTRVHIESAYKTMWKTFEEGGVPRSFSVQRCQNC